MTLFLVNKHPCAFSLVYLLSKISVRVGSSFEDANYDSHGSEKWTEADKLLKIVADNET